MPPLVDESANVIAMKSLSIHGHAPCILLQMPNLCVLLDAAVDMTPLVQFLPCFAVECVRLSSLPGWTGGKSTVDASLVDQIKDCCQQAFVDAVPEVMPMDLSTTAVYSIDAVFISNSSTIIGLPFLATKPGFRAKIYASDATIQMGKLLINEITTLLESVQKEQTEAKWKKPDVYKTFPNGLPDKPSLWTQMYEQSVIDVIVDRMIPVAVNETIDLCDGISVQSISAGFCIGSLNWKFSVHDKSIGYMSSTSLISHHSRPVSYEPLQNVDALIITNLNQTPTMEPKDSMQTLCKVVEQTVRECGNVLIACVCSGVMFDLIECVNDYLHQNSTMYWISPSAEHSLAYSQIFSDWLADGKQRNIYEPAEPFIHSELVRIGRLKVYSSISGEFSREFKSPAVVFAGHPSLRFGDVVHLMDLWADDPVNSLVLTDPSFMMAQALAPWQPLAMRTFFCPIDTRLDFGRANGLLHGLAPGVVLTNKQYVKQNAEQLLAVDYPATTPFECNSTVNVCAFAPSTSVTLDPTMGQALSIRNESRRSLPLAAIHAQLRIDDNQMTIVQACKPKNTDENTESGRPVLCGQLNAQQVMNIFTNSVPAGCEFKLEELTPNCFKISCPQMQFSITIKDGLQTHVVCEREDPDIRKMIRTVLYGCLQSLPA